MKLRTIQDFKKIGNDGFIKNEYIDIKDLKQETIKWVHNWENTLEHTRVLMLDELMDRARRHTRLECHFAIKWVKYFFNITDEDLK